MLRRLFVVLTSVTIGLMAGLVLTGRMRSAEVTSAAPASEPQAAAQTRSAPRGRGRRAAGPHRHRAARHRQRHQHLVHAGRAHAAHQRSVLPLLLPGGRPVSRAASAEPRLGRRGVGRRLRAHQQSRRRQRRRRRSRRVQRQARAPRQGHRHGSAHRPRRAQARGHEPAGPADGATRRSCASPSGCSRSATRSS